MLEIMSAVLAGMVVLPALMAVVAFGAGQRGPRLTGRLGAGVAGLGFAGAVVLLVLAGSGDPVSVSVGPLDLAADRLAVVLLLLVFGVSAIVQSFALRYLAGDPRANWFVGGAGLLTAASAGLMTVSSLLGLAVFWTAAGVALCLLLGMYWHLPAARDGVRRTALAFLIGDLALWSAVGVATATWGHIDLRDIQAGQFGGGLTGVLAILVVVAALSRSAQIPFHRWLPATLTAPTPVSALLHAGVVNAGGILLIRLAPLATDDLARVLAILAGTATMAYGAVVMMVKPDVKGALVNSTSAQMGFMILTCGLGLWAAAVIHLVAHGFYKATLFLSSGSAIASRRRHEALPAAARLTGRAKILAAIATAVVPTVSVLAALAVAPVHAGDHAAEQALLGFAWVTAAAITWGWLQRRPDPAGVAGVAAVLIPGTIAYLAVVNAISGYLDPALPPSALPAPVVWIVTLTALAALAALAAARRIPGTERLQRVLYARALSAGHLGTSRTISPALLTGVRS
ncbi:MAG: proton-conducting transporter membrane subunit [Mycobacterium sp.]